MSKSSLQKTVVLLSAAALAAAVNAVQADEYTAPSLLILLQ